MQQFTAQLDKTAKTTPSGRFALPDVLMAVATENKTSNVAKAFKTTYSGIDPFMKYTNFINGLKRAGIDIDAKSSKFGQLVDPEAATKWLEGSWGSKGWSGPVPTSPERLRTRVFDVMARVISESHPQQSTIGKIPELSSQVGDLTLGAIGPLFGRTAAEVLRVNASLPYRAVARPGVAASLAQAAIAGGTLVGAGMAMNRRMGLTPEAEDRAWKRMPPGATKYRPGLQATWVKAANGDVMMLDPGRILEPLKYLSGDPKGRKLADQVSDSPGKMVGNVAFNATAGTLLGDVPQDWLYRVAANYGLVPPPRAEFTDRDPGFMRMLEDAFKLAGPTFVQQTLRGIQDTRAGRTSAAQAAASTLTGGAIQWSSQRNPVRPAEAKPAQPAKLPNNRSAGPIRGFFK
jgi:hypothetical protein